MRILILLILLATPALAWPPIAPDDDCMGVYFDTGGTEYCLVLGDWVPAIGAGPGVIESYILVTRPDTEHPAIQAWEARLTIETNSYLEPEVTLTPDAIDFDADVPDFVVGCGGPAAIPIFEEVAVLATISVEYLGLEGEAYVAYSLEGVQGSLSFPDGPGYAAEAGVPSSRYPMFGVWGELAWVNGYCPHANETLTWGDVKELY